MGGVSGSGALSRRWWADGRGPGPREAVRLQAAALFAQDVPVPEIARRLRVSHNAVYVWRRRWLADGAAGLASKGPSGTGCRLCGRLPNSMSTATEVELLRFELVRGCAFVQCCPS
ncbi:helix-turn-helix domain-containing protein [Dactylosporangium salmoneum]|uniref:helix-turn-helix domain-containing protein n=1 Tax=Dactylosporangium salmoneum TaxID=53361 RepID=UPI0031DF8271